ncbi:DMT family transporter [Rhodobacteraceae bacterium NNCM2]|nr:DMT family transporter [Coraliihabitans acroporae]
MLRERREGGAGRTVPNRNAIQGHAAMLLFAAIISVSFSLGDLAAPHIAPAALTSARFAIAAVIIGIFAAPRMRRAHLAAAWRYVAVGGLLAAYFILMFEALRLTDPVSTGAIFTLTPIMSAAFGYLLMRQITTPLMAVSLLLAGVGAIWVIFRADVEAMLGLRLDRGEQIFLVGCALHALYTPLGRMLNRGEPTIVYSFGGICGGFLVAICWGFRDVVATDWLALPWIAWAAIFYLSIFATAITFSLVQFSTLRLPSAKVMAYGYLVPSFVIVWEGLLGHGWVAPQVWFGVAMTVAALLILLRE